MRRRPDSFERTAPAAWPLHANPLVDARCRCVTPPRRSFRRISAGEAAAQAFALPFSSDHAIAAISPTPATNAPHNQARDRLGAVAGAGTDAAFSTGDGA